MPTINLEAGEFRYSEYGDDGAPPLVLLHGLGSDRSTWARASPELATGGYRVLALDQRGHGESVRTSTYSFEEMLGCWWWTVRLPMAAAPGIPGLGPMATFHTTGPWCQPYARSSAAPTRRGGQNCTRSLAQR